MNMESLIAVKFKQTACGASNTTVEWVKDGFGGLSPEYFLRARACERWRTAIREIKLCSSLRFLLRREGWYIVGLTSVAVHFSFAIIFVYISAFVIPAHSVIILNRVAK